MSTAAILPFPPLPALAWDRAEPVPSAVTPPPAASDGALLERVARGDADAFTVLYRRFERPVFGMLLRLAGGRRALAEEWLQEAFTRVWLGAGTHDPSRGEVKPWIFKIALNTARSEMARKRFRALHVSLDETGLDLPDQGAGERGVAARLDEARRATAVNEALERLPEFMREVVVLRCSRELSFAEIAEVTGAPEGTLKSRFHRAVAALRETLGPEEGRAR
jgi:RNA polymerase sigma-70 factor (ECF subfamily)